MGLLLVPDIPVDFPNYIVVLRDGGVELGIDGEATVPPRPIFPTQHAISSILRHISVGNIRYMICLAAACSRG